MKTKKVTPTRYMNTDGSVDIQKVLDDMDYPDICTAYYTYGESIESIADKTFSNYVSDFKLNNATNLKELKDSIYEHVKYNITVESYNYREYEQDIAFDEYKPLFDENKEILNDLECNVCEILSNLVEDFADSNDTVMPVIVMFVYYYENDKHNVTKIDNCTLHYDNIIDEFTITLPGKVKITLQFEDLRDVTIRDNQCFLTIAVTGLMEYLLKHLE